MGWRAHFHELSRFLVVWFAEERQKMPSFFSVLLFLTRLPTHRLTLHTCKSSTSVNPTTDEKRHFAVSPQTSQNLVPYFVWCFLTLTTRTHSIVSHRTRQRSRRTLPETRPNSAATIQRFVAAAAILLVPNSEQTTVFGTRTGVVDLQ